MQPVSAGTDNIKVLRASCIIPDDFNAGAKQQSVTEKQTMLGAFKRDATFEAAFLPTHMEHREEVKNEDGTTYTGEFMNDKMHGFGIQTW